MLYKRLTGLAVELEDLKELHPDVHLNLTKLLEMQPEDLNDLGLFFQVNMERGKGG